MKIMAKDELEDPIGTEWVVTVGADGMVKRTRILLLAGAALEAPLAAAQAGLDAKVAEAADHAATATAAAGILQPFVSLPGAGSALQRINWVRIYDHIPLPANFGPREVGQRDGAGGIKEFRATFFGGADAGTFDKLICTRPSELFLDTSGYMGWRIIPLYALAGAFPGIAGGTQVGWMRFYFDGANFGGLGGAHYMDYDVCGLSLDLVRVEETVVEAIESRIAAARAEISAEIASAIDRADGDFLGTVTDPFLTSFIVSAKVNEAHENARIGINFVERARYSAALYRLQLKAKDFVTGQEFAHNAFIWDHDPVPGGEVMTRIMLFAGALAPNYSGMTLDVEIDPTQLGADKFGWTMASPWTQEFSLYSKCGLKLDTYSTTEKQDDFLDRSIPAHTIRIGDVPAPDFAELQEAVVSKYLPDDLLPDGYPTRTSYPLTYESSYSNQQKFELGADQHIEKVQQLFPLIYSEMVGRGAFATKLWGDAAFPLIDSIQSYRLAKMALEQRNNGNYAIHAGSPSIIAKNPTMGPPGQLWRRRLAWEELLIMVGAGHSAAMIGQDLSSSERGHARDVHFHRANPASLFPAWLVHDDTPGMVEPAYWHLERVSTNLTAAPSLLLQTLAGHSVRSRFLVEDCTMALIKGEVQIPDNHARMPRRARDRWNYDVAVVGGNVEELQISDPKMRVLALPAGTTITGGTPAAIDALFGMFDWETGRSDQLMLDGSIRALATRLGGDRTSDPWSIDTYHPANGAQTITMNANYAGMAEGAALADMNDGGSLLSIVRIDTEIGFV